MKHLLVQVTDEYHVEVFTQVDKFDSVELAEEHILKLREYCCKDEYIIVPVYSA